MHMMYILLNTVKVVLEAQPERSSDSRTDCRCLSRACLLPKQPPTTFSRLSLSPEHVNPMSIWVVDLANWFLSNEVS
jgi:hypothetical protein